MKEYFYIDSNNLQKGPVTGERLKEYGVNTDTPVWCDGMSEWTPAGKVDELKPLFYGQSVTLDQKPPLPGGMGQQRQSYGQTCYGGGVQQPYGYGQPYNSNPQYGGYNQPRPMMSKPDSWLAWSILCTILCCLPLGVVGIVYAAQVDSLWNQGRYEESVKAAKKAKTFTLIGIISSAAIAFCYFVFWIFAVALGVGAASGSYIN